MDYSHLAANEFVEIAPLPNPGGGGKATSGDLPGYVNAVFTLAIAIGAVLAVLLIAIGGMEYMFSEAFSTKESGKRRMTQALYGLALLLLVYLILFIINPQLVSLELFA